MSGIGNHDPGWNDPPTFSYNPEAVVTKPKNLLNKRVPYAINSTSISRDSAPLIAPPISVPIPNLESNINEDPVIEKVSIDEKKIANFEKSINIFRQLVDNSPELGKKVTDIQKRINILETMWKEGKLNHDVQHRTALLAKALEESNTKIADDIHKALMVDHVSSVSPWMVGVKQLIFHYTAKNELLKIDQE